MKLACEPNELERTYSLWQIKMQSKQGYNTPPGTRDAHNLFPMTNENEI